jgi:curved DNA-binding protein
VTIPYTGACLGTSVDIETLEGNKRIKVKPGTQSGSKIRLKGFGVAGRPGKQAGDLYAVIEVKVPKELGSEQKELLQKLKEKGL